MRDVRLAVLIFTLLAVGSLAGRVSAATLSLASVPDEPTPTPAIGASVAPTRTLIAAVPHAAQSFNLSCESRSAVDVAAFWNVTIGETEFLAALPRSDNPHKGFVGDVNASPGSLPPTGYGVYAEPVAATLRRFGLYAHARSRLGIQGLQAELAAGRPVIVWATYGLQDYAVQDWVSADNVTSRIVPYEHTFIAVGYDAEGVYLIDAYDAVLKHYLYAAFEASWSKFEQMAVVVNGPLQVVLNCRPRTRAGWRSPACRW